MVDLGELKGHVEILRYCKSQMADLEEMRERSRAVIEEAMGDNEIGEIDGEPVIKWEHSKRRALDQKILKAKFPDVREECMTTTEVRRFEVL